MAKRRYKPVSRKITAIYSALANPVESYGRCVCGGDTILENTLDWSKKPIERCLICRKIMNGGLRSA
jgi:hypothetical protein